MGQPVDWDRYEAIWDDEPRGECASCSRPIYGGELCEECGPDHGGEGG